MTNTRPAKDCLKGLDRSSSHYAYRLEESYIKRLKGLSGINNVGFNNPGSDWRLYQLGKALHDELKNPQVLDTVKGRALIAKIELALKQEAPTGYGELFNLCCVLRTPEMGELLINDYPEELFALLKKTYKSIPGIELTKQKLHIAKQLREALQEGDDEQKISAYKKALSKEAVDNTVSKHRDPYGDRWVSLVPFAVFSGVGIVLLLGFLVYKAMKNYYYYGKSNLFAPDSQNMADGAYNTINKYEHAANKAKVKEMKPFV